MARYSARSVLLVTFGVLACTVLLFGESLRARTLPAPVVQNDKLKDPKSIAEGATLFAPTCGTGYCHGTGGSGGGAPRIRGGRGLAPAEIFKVISSGVGGTAMPAFKSTYSEEQIWKLVAFVLSPPGSEGSVTTQPATPSPATPAPAPTIANASIVGNPQAGKNIFFDSSQAKSCHSCHAFDGSGASIGPDLSKIGTRSAKELFMSIVIPHEKFEARYASIRLTLADGDKLVGIVKQENETEIELYDVTELPAVLRTVQKDKISKRESLNESPMPRDYSNIYTMKQLLDLVTYLKSGDTKLPVTLKDLL